MQMVLKMRTMPQPVIAAVNGAAAGAGMNIALAADIRIAVEEATFGQNFVKVGLFPDYGGADFFPQPVGPPHNPGGFFSPGKKTRLSSGRQRRAKNKQTPAPLSNERGPARGEEKHSPWPRNLKSG